MERRAAAQSEIQEIKMKARRVWSVNPAYILGAWVMPYTWVVPIFRDANGLCMVRVPFCLGLN